MATDFDPYRILEVDSSAGQDQIDEAYRRQWAAYPRDPSPEARLREIQAAYRILSDPAERRSYDERRASAPGAPTAVAEIASLGAPTEAIPTRRMDPARSAPWGTRDLLTVVVLTIVCVIAAGLPFAIAASEIAGRRDNIDFDPNALGVQFLGGIVVDALLVGIVWWFSVRKYHLTWADFGIRPPERGWPWLPFAVAVGAMASVIIYGLIASAFGWEPETDLPKATYDHAFPLILAFILAVFIAPVAEEIFFRGFIFGGLVGKWGLVPAAIVTGSAFGLAHIFNAGGLYIVFPISMIGAIFCWAYYYSRSITTTIAAHLIFNLVQVAVAIATQ